MIYGAFFGGVAGMIAFFAKFRLPVLVTADVVAPTLMLGLAIGRIGCFLNGCCFGGLCDLPWAVSFPAGSPPYVNQVARGIMDGLVLSGNPKAPAIVQAVLPHSPAESAGLRPGDRLRKIDGFDVQNAGQANKILNSTSTPASASTSESRWPWNLRMDKSCGSRPVGCRITAVLSILRNFTAQSASSDLPALAGLRSISPAKRRIVGVDVDGVSSVAFPRRDDSHRRTGDFRDGDDHLAEHQPAVAALRRGDVAVRVAPAETVVARRPKACLPLRGGLTSVPRGGMIKVDVLLRRELFSPPRHPYSVRPL